VESENPLRRAAGVRKKIPVRKRAFIGLAKGGGGRRSDRPGKKTGNCVSQGVEAETKTPRRGLTANAVGKNACPTLVGNCSNTQVSDLSPNESERGAQLYSALRKKQKTAKEPKYRKSFVCGKKKRKREKQKHNGRKVKKTCKKEDGPLRKDARGMLRPRRGIVGEKRPKGSTT